MSVMDKTRNKVFKLLKEKIAIRKYKDFFFFCFTGIINSCHELWKRCERLVGLTKTQCSDVSVRNYVDLVDPALN